MAAKPDPVTVAAARLRVTTDAKQGLTTPEPIKALAKQSTGGTMSQHIIQAEIVRPHRPAAEQFGTFLAALFWLAFRVLIIWWALAAWFPQLGITYWQAILPVYAIRCLVSSQTIIGRQLTK